jgi:uncharacterized protein YbbC (DUF1343 family)/CubicO group peptidase (beta-lactamase class C family)
MKAAARTLGIIPILCIHLWGAVASFSGASAVDQLIEKAIADGKIPGAVLIVGHDGQVVYRKAYGQRAIVPNAESMTIDTIFDCASLTKVVATTSAVMKLSEEGKIRIGDKVTGYIPEFQNGKSDITVQDLMTHYSGLRPDLDLEPAWSGYQTGIAKAVVDPPAGPREVKFVYSDINFVLLGEIVRRVSGQTLDEYTHRHIFEPLGMTNTMFLPSQGLQGRIAPTETLKDGQILRGVVHDPTSRYMGGVAGHAGLFSTGDDLARFCQMLLNKGVNPAADATHPAKLFNAATVDLFTSGHNPLGTTAVRGLGWDIDSPFSGNRGELFPLGKSFGHTGYTGTSLWIDPVSQTYYVLLTNAVHPHDLHKPITPLRRNVATAVAAAVGYPRAGGVPVMTGLDALAAQRFAPLRGKRVGLITNHTGIDKNGRRNIDLMRAQGIKITALFSPEHGFLGLEDKKNIQGTVDGKTGLRVYSLYSEKTMRPTPEMLRDVDVVVFDIADTGTRFYTYATTMAYAMQECAKTRKPFIVLDRPNPITGQHVEGPILDAANRSFVGFFSVPLRHGMTIGELASLFNTEAGIHADLTVVPVAGWRRADWFDGTGLPWVDPSPNIRNLTAALLYPAIAMLEYSENYSVGRGTAEPFEQVGAPWIRGAELANYLNSRDVPGVRAHPVRFRPNSNHLAGVELEGARFTVTDRAVFDAGRFGLELAAALQKLYPGRIDFAKNRKLIGSEDALRRLATGDDPKEIWESEQLPLERFNKTRSKYLLYQ